MSAIKATQRFNAIPAIDFGHYLFGNPTVKKRSSNLLYKCLQEQGIVKLNNYGISPGLVQKTFEMSRAFFHLPLEQKMKASHPEQASPHRGYSFVGQEKIAGISGFADGFVPSEDVVDVKETMDWGNPDDMKFPNRWPDSKIIPEFQSTMETAFREYHGLLLRVLESLATSMNMPRNYFTKLHLGMDHEMRSLHYPSTKVGDFKKGNTRIADHTDFGSVSLLAQDSTGGLEARVGEKDDPKYAAIESQPTELLVILGDCFQRWTGDKLHAIPHRVSMPFDTDIAKEDTILPERFSLAFFGKPDREVKVGSLDLPYLDGRTEYPDITAGQYNNQKLFRTY